MERIQINRQGRRILPGLCAPLLLAMLCWATMASAARSIAFFPLLDLSDDPNGINSQLTERVYQELLSHGKKLIPAEEVMQFLIRNRIRTLGKLTRYQTSLIKKELKADLLLQGTVCQITDGEQPMLSLNLQLSRTSDEQIIWASTKNLSFWDLTSLLGLEDPQTLEELYEPFFTNLFATMPEQVEMGNETLNTLNIATVIIHPKYLRSGEQVSCRIKIHTPLDEDSPTPKMVLLVDGQEYPLVLDEEGYYLESSWLAKQDAAGSYPITLVAEWPSGITQRGVLGSYTIDVQEPGAQLQVIGIERDGEILFSDKLLIIPKILEPEPIIRWEITVIDEWDEPIVIMGAAGHIPRRLTWQGKTSLGNMAPPGEYLIRFKVWDRAERESITETRVMFLPEPPEILVDVTQDQDQVVINLDNMVDTPLNYWWAKFYQEDGRLLKLAQGTELPAVIELDTISEPGQELQFLLTARDILGNQSQQNIPNLFQLTEDEPEEAESNMETEWVEEF
jgi:hypothetical protein